MHCSPEGDQCVFLWAYPERTRPGGFINTGDARKETQMEKLREFWRHLRFGKEFRLSIAEQVKKISWSVMALFALFGYKTDMEHMSMTMVLCVGVAWLVCQVVAHGLVAYKNTS